MSGITNLYLTVVVGDDVTVVHCSRCTLPIGDLISILVHVTRLKFNHVT